MRFKQCLALSALAAALAFLFAPQPGLTAAPQPPIRVAYGFDREYPPFSYEDPGGNATGFEVELLQAVFHGSNVELSMRPLNWDNIPIELSANTIQVTSGMVRTPQRAELYLFSDQPSFQLEIRLFTKVYNRVPSAALLRGQAVAVDEGSYPHRVLQDFGGINIKPFKNRTAGLRALYNDEVAAYCGLKQNTYFYINKLQYGAITTVGTPLSVTEMHFAVNRERGDLKTLIDKGMARVLKSGEYDRLFRKWFVQDMTSQELDVVIKQAKEAAVPAYAPYSGKGQGAAVVSVTGKVFTACTMENADPKLTVSALAGALSRAISAGEFEIRAAVVTWADGVVADPTPEEINTLFEFGRGILVIRSEENGALVQRMLPELMPPTDRLPPVPPRNG